MFKARIFYFVLFFFIMTAFSTPAEEQGSDIDASDPTKIYTYAGAGIKYSDYTNNEYMVELRATGNIGLSTSDMLMFELGYGTSSDDNTPGDDSGLTNSRLRWFHLFPMDDSIESGYRGWGTQVDMQFAGSVKGTDGQNTLAIGGLPAFGINKNWSLYLPVNLVSTWDKNFDEHNGIGIGVAPLLVYSPDNWWQGAFVQFWPNYTYFISGELEDSGSGNLDLIVGGSITDKILWSTTLQKNVDEDLHSYRRGRDTGLQNDWNVFFSVTTYF